MKRQYFSYLFLLLFVSVCYGEENERVELIWGDFEQTSLYRYATPINQMYSEVFPITYFIRTEENLSDYVVLDSIKTRHFNLCDTNVVIYSDVGEQFTYLVAMILSPQVIHDTLIKASNSGPKNWITDYRYIPCSYRDSLFVLSQRKSSKDMEINLIRVLPECKFESVRFFEHVRSAVLSHDFNQLLICTEIDNELSLGVPGSVFVYEPGRDSTYNLIELDSLNILAKRWSYNAPVYLLKEEDSITNVWKYNLTDNKKTQVTFFEYPKKITHFNLYQNSLELTYHDITDSNRTSYIRTIPNN